MLNSRFWLYYSLIMAVGVFCVRPADATIIVWRSYGTAGSQEEYDTCMEEVDSYCPEYSGSQKARVICSNIVSDITEGCSGSDQGDLYNILEFSGHTFDCHNTTAIVHRLHSCNACTQSGGYPVRPVRYEGLCGNNVPWEWNKAVTDVELIIEWQSGETPCSDAVFVSGDLKVCVGCSPENEGNWVVDSGLRMRSNVLLCGQVDPDASAYGCKANSYLYGTPRTGATIDCRACPTYASCTQTDGHRDYFTCPTGMVRGPNNSNYMATGCACSQGKYIDDGICSDCPENTYQPVAWNLGELDSCEVCPEICDIQSTTQGLTGATGLRACCVSPSDETDDDFGHFHPKYGMCGS